VFEPFEFAEAHVGVGLFDRGIAGELAEGLASGEQNCGKAGGDDGEMYFHTD
jgi:hypothetical protein